jgi:hypothetical protein
MRKTKWYLVEKFKRSFEREHWRRESIDDVGWELSLKF